MLSKGRETSLPGPHSDSLRPARCPQEHPAASKTTSNHPSLAIDQVLLRTDTTLKSQLQLCSSGWYHSPVFHEESEGKLMQKGQEELRPSLALPSIGSGGCPAGRGTAELPSEESESRAESHQPMDVALRKS